MALKKPGRVIGFCCCGGASLWRFSCHQPQLACDAALPDTGMGQHGVKGGGELAFLNLGPIARAHLKDGHSPALFPRSSRHLPGVVCGVIPSA